MGKRCVCVGLNFDASQWGVSTLERLIGGWIMARMFPDSQGSRVVFTSHGEAAFYEACRTQLSDQWNVFYSCTLSKIESGKGLVDNEIDFVLYHPNWGIVVLELKGGRISYDPLKGKFSSINRFDKSFPIKNPFQQALIWKSRFVRVLRSQGIRCPISHGVVFPNVQEQSIPESGEFPSELVLGMTRLRNLERSLVGLVKKSHPDRYLDFPDVATEVIKILKGARFQTKLHIRDYIDSHESMLKDVEAIHKTLVMPIANSKRIAIEGEAGTGKTMLAIFLAEHFRNLGKKVLLLSSNVLLNASLRDQLSLDIKVQTYWEFASGFGVELLRRPAGFAGSREDWVQFVGPEKLKEAIVASQSRYDVILCDESQDVQPFWWEAITGALRSDDSHIYIFFDRSQGVFGSGSSEESFVPEDVLPVPAPYFCLVNNYRTTREISQFSQLFRTGSSIIKSHSERLGFKPILVLYKDNEDLREKLSNNLERLLELEGMRSEEIAILSARSPFKEGSVLEGIESLGRFGIYDLGTAKKRRLPKPQELLDKVQLSTISSFKGLETDVAMIVNLDEYNLPLDHPIMSSLFYVACTRAKHMLYIFAQEGSEKAQRLDEELSRIKDDGSVVLGGQGGRYELSGVVTHYNPERFGWIKVSSDGQERTREVMFFPHDILQANIGSISVGQKLMFRAVSEGFVTIASDIKVSV